MDPELRLALGSWQVSLSESASKTSSMPIRYTDEPMRLEMQIQERQSFECNTWDGFGPPVESLQSRVGEQF